MIAVASQFFVNGALFASFVPRLPEIRNTVGVGTEGIGLALSVAGATGLIGSLLTARAIERFGTRTVILGAGILVSVSLAAIGWAEALPLLLIGLMGMSTFDVMVDTSMNLQGSWLSAKRETPVMNRLHGLWSLGTVLGGVIAARAASAGVSLRTHLSLVAIALLAGLLGVSRGLLRHDEATTDPGETSAAKAGADAVGPASIGAASIGAALPLFFLAGFFGVSIEMTAIDWAAFRLGDDLGASGGVAALGYVAVTLGMTAGRFAGDSLTKRIGGDRLIQGATLLAGVALLVACLSPNRTVVIGAYLMAGLGASTMMPRLYDQAAQRPGKRGAGLGLLTAGLRTAVLIVPAVVGALATARGSVAVGIAVVTTPAVLAFMFVLHRLRPQAPNSTGTSTTTASSGPSISTSASKG